MLTTFRTLVCCIALVCFSTIASAQPPRMTPQQVIATAKPAIEARFPGTTKNHTLVAYVIPDGGYWTVFFLYPGQPEHPNHGEPFALVRDSDGKVVGVSVMP